MLVDVGALIGQTHLSSVLVAGDFNAKSSAWGSRVTDARGEALQEWAVSMGLEIMNRGSVSTCVRQQGESIVDVTLASSDLARRVHGWKVEEGEETLSDHQYIRFDISTLPITLERANWFPIEQGARWSLKRLDREMATEAAIVEAWVDDESHPVVTDDVDATSERLVNALIHVCDAAMPRVKPTPPRRQLYWWKAELRQLRTACVASRRLYT